MSVEAARTTRELQMLEAMVDCAHALGMAFGAAAKAQADTRRSLEFLDGFHKSFLAVRMGIRLCMTLRAAPKALPATAPAPAQAPERAEALERDSIEREAPERPRGVERERDRDDEPVSLPKFLATLGVVARDAARLDDRLPADAGRALPALQGLLAQATAGRPAEEPAVPLAAGAAFLARPPPGGTRHRLLGSAVPSLPGPGRRSPRLSGSG